MGSRLKTGLRNKILSILNTYATHMGYLNEHFNTYWATLSQYIDTIPNTYECGAPTSTDELRNLQTQTQIILDTGKWRTKLIKVMAID